MTSSLFTHQRAEFNNQFRGSFGNAFQHWFEGIARKLHPDGDVQAIRITQGDGKLDLVVLNQQLVYQCYGPSAFKTSVAKKKITEDFWGAYKHLNGKLRKWVFVHNHPTGQIDKDCCKALSDIIGECRAQGTEIEILAWGIEEVWEAVEKSLSVASLRELFGSPDPVTISFACIEQLLHTLERAAYPEDVAAIPQPSVDKLNFNDLGPAYRREIREGRNGLRIIGGYLVSRASSDPEFAESLAQRFRDRYLYLKNLGTLVSNEIYENLRMDAGWKASPDAAREMATRAILAYFFETCDIFENQLEEL
ncbi:MAG: ABC-three component system protein [Kiritimatiellia bacterium]